MIFFGTDGIRGVVNKDLDFDTIYLLGKALATIKPYCRILIGKDTRKSGDYVLHTFASGAMENGAKILDVGIIATPGIAYLTKEKGFDFGVAITASHNTHEYNGIKIFDNEGIKINESIENQLVELMKKPKNLSIFGSYTKNVSIRELYVKFLKKLGNDMSDISITIDCANGATSGYAQDIFYSLKAKCCFLNYLPNGENINRKSGILDNELLLRKKIEYRTDYALAFDGDGDRLVLIDKYDNILDGDKILYILTNTLKQTQTIKTVVGTVQMNLGIEKALNSLGVNVVKTQVGDKNIVKELKKENLLLGAEQSGHIIITNYLNTGDGILTGIILINIIEKLWKDGNYKSIIDKAVKYPQSSLNYKTNFKNEIYTSPLLNEFVNKMNHQINPKILLDVRKSGTENLIRINCQSNDKNLNEKIIQDVKCLIEKIEVDIVNNA